MFVLCGVLDLLCFGFFCFQGFCFRAARLFVDLTLVICCFFFAFVLIPFLAIFACDRIFCGVLLLSLLLSIEDQMASIPCVSWACFFVRLPQAFPLQPYRTIQKPVTVVDDGALKASSFSVTTCSVKNNTAVPPASCKKKTVFFLDEMQYTRKKRKQCVFPLRFSSRLPFPATNRPEER